MIVKVEAFKIICDGCSCFFREGGESAELFPTIADAQYDFRESIEGDEEYDWVEKDGKHLCPVCAKEA